MKPYSADRSLQGKLRRRLVRLQHRRSSPGRPPRPMISFSFDDAPQSAFETGARILEARGLRGTFFVAAGLADRDEGLGRCGGREAVQAAAAAGHEIACHTFSHLDCGRAEGQAVADDLDRNLEALDAWGVPPPSTFAYPYGDVAAPAKREAGRRFALARALHHGLITHRADLNQAPAVGVEGAGGEALAMDWMARAQARDAWLILFTHGVEDAPSRFGTSAATWARLADRALAGGFEVVTVAEGARRIGAGL
jgi:peptidoglycan/xylan/chitin deacetylase (PgdA/CDA1 family)